MYNNAFQRWLFDGFSFFKYRFPVKAKTKVNYSVLFC